MYALFAYAWFSKFEALLFILLTRKMEMLMRARIISIAHITQRNEWDQVKI